MLGVPNAKATAQSTKVAARSRDVQSASGFVPQVPFVTKVGGLLQKSVDAKVLSLLPICSTERVENYFPAAIQFVCKSHQNGRRRASRAFILFNEVAEFLR